MPPGTKYRVESQEWIWVYAWKWICGDRRRDVKRAGWKVLILAPEFWKTSDPYNPGTMADLKDFIQNLP